MNLMLFILLEIFSLKILWNLIVPHELAWRGYKSDKNKSSGLSLMPYLEIGLLLLVVLISAIAGKSDKLFNPKGLAVWGCVAIVVSYVHLVIAGMIVGWIVSILKHNRK
jgi:hypothetical protein